MAMFSVTPFGGRDNGDDHSYIKEVVVTFGWVTQLEFPRHKGRCQLEVGAPIMILLTQGSRVKPLFKGLFQMEFTGILNKNMGVGSVSLLTQHSLQAWLYQEILEPKHCLRGS